MSVIIIGSIEENKCDFLILLSLTLMCLKINKYTKIFLSINLNISHSFLFYLLYYVKAFVCYDFSNFMQS